MDIIDRRPNPHGKNLENRQRVIARARAAVTQATRDAVAKGTLREVGRDQAVTIPADALNEPSFHTVFTEGKRHFVLSGNREFSVGDRINRPPGGGGGGSGSGDGQGSGSGEEGFRFVLTREEFLDLFFDDLELPDLVKGQVMSTEISAPIRTGISVDGTPSQIDMARTMRQSMARRIGLRRPKSEEVLALELEIAALEQAGEEPERLRLLRLELEQAMRRMARVPWVDPVDLRYRRFTQLPKPSPRAVMFCLMDVSGSMSETMKDLAKRFFLLLHVFLERRYKRVELVFIRHTETAEEVDENTFFTDPRTGGTVVSTALAEMARIQKERYPEDSWNIYAAQASDGDNSLSDTQQAVSMLEKDILPLVQHFAYIEVSASAAMIRGETDLWRGYEPLSRRAPKLAMSRVGDKRDIFPVFRQLFGRKPAAAAGAAPA
ncbi:YeaH/YhbH family protein [Roseomonas sp. OT10]|uniref:YeaH/YhbH family protein n=1 Tax=Roseomonas cutis TaxID=2897332 RepID=UPI001E3A27DA|nr:YeaH/YhbH family protein [Roseomonas sp. OT10]UFN47434.1 YeaH/YhbH family protein [Roseomonas sp. OT10]